MTARARRSSRSGGHGGRCARRRARRRRLRAEYAQTTEDLDLGSWRSPAGAWPASRRAGKGAWATGPSSS
jgi:hypothetical protein